MQKEVSKLFSRSKLIILLILGSLSWSLAMVKSGWVYSYGIGFWGPNGHDGIWHIALAESLARGSREIPVFSGEALRNYHIGFDLLVAVLSKLTSVPITNLYFQILPPTFALLIGFLAYKFVLLWKKNESSAYWSTFFVYFGGSFAWILGKGESAFWSQQAVSTLVNPPFALSLVFILAGMISLLKKKTFLAILFFGPLVQIKAYAAVLILGSLLVSRHFKVFLGSLVFSLILVFLSKSSSFPFVWQPFWFLETMMQLTDRVGWLKFGEAMVNWRAAGLWYKAVPAYLFAFGLFWFGNMGTRAFKELLVWRWIKDIKMFEPIGIFIAVIVVSGGIIPMFFLQKGTPWNTIQFFYYSLFFSGILAGISLSGILSKIKSHATYYILLSTVIVLTIPTTIITLKDVYIPNRPPAMLSNSELDALRFLSEQPAGVVLTFPFDSIKAKEAETNPPRPLYLYESSAYVSAFSKKPVFFEDEVNLDITNYNWRERREKVEGWYKEKDQSRSRDFLKKNNISYIYWLKGQRGFLGEDQLGLKRIYKNNEVDIFEVNLD